MKLTLEKAKKMMEGNEGSLNLRGTNIQTLPEGLTVGGDEYLRDLSINNRKYRLLKNGDYKAGKYLYVDGILTHVKSKRKVRGYTLYVGKIKGQNVVSDGTHYAHCKTLRDGIADLAFKNAKDRGADQYKDLTLDSVLTSEEIITMYRIITGACQQGTARFVESLGPIQDTYTVREAIEITKGQYGTERFAQFFGV